MRSNRRDFLKIGGLSVAATGLVPGFLASCQSENSDTVFTSLVKGVEPLTGADYGYRLERLLKYMKEFNVEAIFIEGATNLKYFFNLSWHLSERTFGAILNTKGKPVWICPAFELERAKEQIPSDHTIRTWEEHESPFKLFAGIIKEMGLTSANIGMGPTVRSFINEGFRRELPSGLVDGSMPINMTRGVKTEKELAYMDLANNITKRAFRYAFDNLREGMTPQDIGDLTRVAHDGMGAPGGGSPLIGFMSAYPHGTNQIKELAPGDIILVDGGCAVEGFRSDVTRTVVFGKPSDRQREVFDVVLKAQKAAHNAVRPGVKCSEIDHAARKVMEDSGFGPGYKYFAHRLGHGVGMDGHEFPYLVGGNDLELRPGMTFSNEPGIYIYGEFGVRIEDCFHVTEQGAQMFGGMYTTSIEEPFGSDI